MEFMSPFSDNSLEILVISRVFSIFRASCRVIDPTKYVAMREKKTLDIIPFRGYNFH